LALKMALPLPAPHHRFTVAEYYRMAEAGILSEHDRVELIRGEIIEITPIGSPHAAIADRLTRLLVQLAGSAAIVRVQNPVRLSDDSEPEPDFALLVPRDDDYASGHPGPLDVLLLIEVAETSIVYDRDVKVPMYAEEGIPEVWIFDLTSSHVLVFREPAEGRYASAQTLGKGDTVTSTRLPPIRVRIADVLR
jgi:Uma2 family endonuclease